MTRFPSLVATSIVILAAANSALALEPFVTARRGWGPEQATGAPNTPAAGDYTTAWASATPDGADEWLELEYAEPVLAEWVLIHETYNPGAVVKVTGYTDSGMDADLWAGKDPTAIGAGKGVSEIPLKGKLETKRIRLHIDSKGVPGWNEIDAVGLKDAKGKIHWAVGAKASSTFGAGAAPMAFLGPAPAPVLPVGIIKVFGAVKIAPGAIEAVPVKVGAGKADWGPEQATGEPDTKVAGDQTSAWASATPDGDDEWLELEYAAPMKIETVQIFETYNPGAVCRVTGYNEVGKEVDLWEGKDPVDPTKEMGTAEIPVKGKLTTNRIRIYLKSKEVPGWNEIDAVAIKDAAGKSQWAVKATASSTFADFAGGFFDDDFGGPFGGPDVPPLPAKPAADPVVPPPAVPRPPPVAPPRPKVVPRPVRPEPRDARIDKLEQEVKDLKKSLEELQKLLEKR